MMKSYRGKGPMFFRVHAPIILFLILMSPLALVGCQSVVNPEYDHLQKVEYIGNPVSNIFEKDPVMSLLGKSFLEIKQVLGSRMNRGTAVGLDRITIFFIDMKKGSFNFVLRSS